MPVNGVLQEQSDEDAIRHLFGVAASLDSMVVGEAQILSQVKLAYETARETDSAGPITNAAFQTALRVAKCVASETAINQRPLFMLDLAVPRDLDPAIVDVLGVYLYSIDDLQRACESNRRARERELPKAQRIIESETSRFLADITHRGTGPTIQRLKAQANELKEEELKRLLNKLSDVDIHTQEELQRSFDRLVNKLLHPPLESLRDEAESGTHHGLLDALKRLFQLKD